MARKSKVVSEYARMWPRWVLSLKKKDLPNEIKKRLNHSGVYVLYTDAGEPYYVGQAKDSLLKRLSVHANTPRSRHFHFWNFFSAYVVPTRYLDAVEGILITSMMMVTANRANPRLTRIQLPKEVWELRPDEQQLDQLRRLQEAVKRLEKELKKKNPRDRRE